MVTSVVFFFFQAEDGIRDLVRSRGLGDVYKRQAPFRRDALPAATHLGAVNDVVVHQGRGVQKFHDLSLIHI